MGPSASGKSTLAKELQRSFPARFARVPADFFIVPRPAGTTLEEFCSCPLDYDWPAVDRAIAAHGPGRSTPDFDFEAFTRVADTGGIEIAEAPVAVLDGMRPHPNADFTVMCELDPGEQQRRLASRDARWGTRVRNRSAQLTLTFEAGMSDLSGPADLVLPAEASVNLKVERIIQALPRWP